MIKPNQTTIPMLLEAGEFKALQSLMLEQNMTDKVFYPFNVQPPLFKGDKWKAFYFKDITKAVQKPKAI